MNSTLKKKKKIETFANLVVIAQNVKYLKRGKMVPNGVSWPLTQVKKPKCDKC